MDFSRPLFHFSCPIGWCNDPNGFSFFKNRVHLFYQWHPYSTKWGPMHWGHATTTDFVHWKTEPGALTPDSPFDMDGCFSGTALDLDGIHMLCYTGVSKNIQHQCLAFGDGLEYKKIDSNPVVDKRNIPFEYQTQDFRDPKIFKMDGSLYMLCVLKKMDGAGAMVLFKNVSRGDFSDWRFVKTIAESKDGKTKMWECPDFFRQGEKDVLIFSPQGMKEDFEKGFHDGNNSVYMLGELDSKTFDFSPELLSNGMDYAQIDFGLDFYAPETGTLPDGRTLMVAWMSSWESPVTPENLPWCGMMVFPRELSLNGNRLVQNPAREILSLRKKRLTFLVDGGKKKIDVPDARHFDAEIKIGTGKNLSLKIGDGNFFVALDYCAEKNILTFDRSHSINGGGKIKKRSAKLFSVDGEQVFLRILVDTNSIEVFANGGEVSFTNAFFIPAVSKNLSIESGGASIDYYELEI